LLVKNLKGGKEMDTQNTIPEENPEIIVETVDTLFEENPEASCEVLNTPEEQTHPEDSKEFPSESEENKGE
jgi:hypothetical protein